MAKTDLKKSSGFDLYLEKGKLASPDLKWKKYGSVLIEDLRDQLLNEDLKYPEVFYDKYIKVDHDNILAGKQLRLNIYVVPSNLAGVEYVKTRAARVSSRPKIMEVYYGGGTIIMQKITKSEQDVIISKIKRDQKILVPAGYTTCLINTRRSNLIVGEVYEDEQRSRAVLDNMKGMAYYLIRKNAKQELVKNPNYRDLPEFRKIKWEEKIKEFDITLRTPIIKQIMRKYDKFGWLFEQDTLEI